MRNLVLAVMMLGAVCVGQSADDNIVVVGNPSQPVQWTHQNSIQAAINRAGAAGTVWIPASYTGTDCNPVSLCNPLGTLVIDLRGGSFQTYPPLPAGNSGSVFASTSYYTPAQPFIDIASDPFGACPIWFPGSGHFSNVNGIPNWNPNCPNGANQQFLEGPTDPATNSEDIFDQNQTLVPVNFGCVSMPGVYCLSPKFPGLTFAQQIANAIANAQSVGMYASIDIDARQLSGTQTFDVIPWQSLLGSGWAPTMTGRIQVCNMSLVSQVPIPLPGGWNFEPVCGRQAGPNQVGFSISYNGPPAYHAGLASNTAATGGTGVTYTFNATPAGGAVWTGGNVVPGEIFAFCTATVTGGKCPGTENAANIAEGMVRTVNADGTLTIVTDAAALADTATSCAGSTACNYVIYPYALGMGDFSGAFGQYQNFGIRVHDLTIQCDGIAGCIPLVNYSCSNMSSADHYWLHPADNICFDIETPNTQQSGPFGPGWCVGKNYGGQACTNGTFGFVIRTFTAKPNGFQGLSAALNGCGTGGTGLGFAVDAPVPVTEWHTLPNGTIGFLMGGAPECPYICISQPYSTTDGTVGLGDCASPVTTCVEWGTNANPVGYSVEGPESSNGSGVTNVFIDLNTGPCTVLQSAENSLHKYIVDYAGNIVLSTSKQASCLDSLVQIAPVAFASVPSCTSGLEGTSRAVNNSNTATYNATVAGGGTNHIVAYCNGTNWVAH